MHLSKKTQISPTFFNTPSRKTPNSFIDPNVLPICCPQEAPLAPMEKMAMKPRSWVRDPSLSSSKLWRVTSGRQANKATLETTNQKTKKRMRDTLKRTTKLLKINGWKMKFFFLAPRPIFRGELLVSFESEHFGIVLLRFAGQVFFGNSMNKIWGMKFCHLNECRYYRKWSKMYKKASIVWYSLKFLRTARNKNSCFKSEFTCGRRGSVALFHGIVPICCWLVPSNFLPSCWPW